MIIDDLVKAHDKQREELREWVYTQSIGLDRTEAFNVFLDDLLTKLEKE